jgi:hypothetical protein
MLSFKLSDEPCAEGYGIANDRHDARMVRMVVVVCLQFRLAKGGIFSARATEFLCSFRLQDRCRLS